MASERRAARASGLPTACAGADPYRAAVALLDGGAAGIVSFGIGGGLAPGLRPGDLVVGTAVVADGVAFMASRAWRDQLRHLLPDARAAVVAGAAEAVATVEAKTALHARTGAALVDMESLGVARACRERGLPFAVLRAVADPAERALPAVAMAGLAPDGRMAPWAVAAGLARDPRQIVALCRLGLDFVRAMAALNAAARALARRPLRLDSPERVGDVA